MSISLNNHEVRITALEKAVRAISNPDYHGGSSYNFAGGLQIRLGKFYVSYSELETTKRIQFDSPFTNNCVSVMFTCENTSGHYQPPGPAYFGGGDKYGMSCWINYDDDRNSCNVWYLAIGYLISNSVKNYAKTLVSKIHLLKNVFCGNGGVGYVY